MTDDMAAAPWLAGQLATDAAWLSAFDDARSSKSTRPADGVSSDPVVLVFQNNTAEPLTLCWVDAKGKLHHFYCVNPSTGPKAIQDGSVDPSHTEFAALGDHFVLFNTSAAGNDHEGNAASYRYVRDIPPATFVLAYTPTAKVGAPHVVTVLPSHGSSGSSGSCSSSSSGFVAVVRPGRGGGGGRLLDTLAKAMDKGTLSGFIVHAEPGVWAAFPGLRRILKEDLAEAARRVPLGAAAALRTATAIWVNVSLTYGREGAPTVGRSMCYHPQGGGGWLAAQGMNPAKAGGVEMYEGAHAGGLGCWSCMLIFRSH